MGARAPHWWCPSEQLSISCCQELGCPFLGSFDLKDLILWFAIWDLFRARFTMCLTGLEWKLLVLLGCRGASRSCLTSSKLLENWGKKVQPSHKGAKWFQKERVVTICFCDVHWVTKPAISQLAKSQTLKKVSLWLNTQARSWKDIKLLMHLSNF